jgi:hypothetical protein
MAMISMKIEGNGESEEMYPEELCIELEAEQLEKLGISAAMRLGTTVTITARAYVKETSATMVEGGVEPAVELQITDMSIDAGGGMGAAATMLYGG